MFKRIQKLLIGVAALAALSLGGSAIVSAQSQPSTAAPAAESATGPDTDTIQSGDQTTPDKPATASKAAAAESTTGADTDSVQSGDQSGADTPDNASAAQSSNGPEAAGSESASGSDGPGGHADEPGNANADHQAEGAE